MSLPVNGVLKNMPAYPFAHLDAKRRELESAGLDIIDLSIGDPGETPPHFIIDAIREGVSQPSRYPRAVGAETLRNSISGWCSRRFGVAIDAETEVIPCNGSKEAIFTLPLAVCNPRTSAVLAPDPGYPVYKQGADFAGAEYIPLPLKEENRFLPDLDAVDAETWAKAALLWINYPNNPTSQTASLDWLQHAASLCRKHNVLLAGDEAYSETYFSDRKPHSVLETGLENVVAVNTLSKRSALPGFRSGFMAGDARLIQALNRFRPGIGNATPGFIQHAAAKAWDDETHAARLRQEFAVRKQAAAEGLRGIGFGVTPSNATIYLWARIPGGESSASLADRCLEAGVVLLPGAAMGAYGEGYIRLSLTRPVPDLQTALDRIRSVV